MKIISLGNCIYLIVWQLFYLFGGLNFITGLTATTQSTPGIPRNIGFFINISMKLKYWQWHFHTSRLEGGHQQFCSSEIDDESGTQ